MPKPNKKNPIITPIQSRAKDTFETILKATTYLLESKGLNGFTSNDIAQKAGVNINSFYQYFLNKEAAVLEVAWRFLKNDDLIFASALVSSNALPQSKKIPMILTQMNKLMTTDLKLRRVILPNLASVIGGAKLFERRRRLAIALAPFLPDRYQNDDDRLLAAQVVVHTFSSVSAGFLEGAVKVVEKEAIQDEINKLIISYVG